MGLVIEDGKGSGRSAAVDFNNKLEVSSICYTQEHYANHAKGRAFNMLIQSVTPSAGGCFCYMKNTDSDYCISIEGFWLWMEADDYIDVKLGETGTPTGVTSVVPGNMNTSSGYVADGDFYYGQDISGLSSGKLTHRIHHANSAASIYWNFNMDIILATNGVLTLYAGAGLTPISITLVFNYHKMAT